ncbi:putative periplasmic ligand-binding sensor domain containing protein [Desulfocurvibacter africanus PCS]|uniref:histidine kinase n=1 Tax=Desulfocurvibacter africanus PCS TaxID=1262666 RepID=M5PPC9_DESAF|nr:CHASE4 domain-containing protein [Desulfocurvibacter africanus]EMG35785.1 putative periplasmic ligand-binding sensor domain containing protein [Desulfocurvibacter africanus PCS]
MATRLYFHWLFCSSTAMSLRIKAVLILILLTAAYAMITLSVQRLCVSPEFEKLEQEHARKDLLRCAYALEDELAHLASAAADWGIWDDTYAFVSAPDARFIESNLTQTAFAELRVHMIHIYDAKAEFVTGGAWDWRSGQAMDPGDAFHLQMKKMLAARKGELPLTGICSTDQAPLLLAVSPILNSHRQGPSRGWLAMGLYLDQEYLEALRRKVQAGFHLDRLDAPPLLQASLRSPSSRAEPDLLVENTSSALKRVSMLKPDLFGRSTFVLWAEVPRTITDVSESALRMSLTGGLLAGIVVLLCLWIFLDQTVLRPLGDIRRHMTGMRQDGDLSRRLPTRRKDEVGLLSREYNAMLDRLGDSRHEALRQTYRLGMAEMASEVLHNVRNTFSPLKAGLFMLRERLAREGALAALPPESARPDHVRLGLGLRNAENKTAELYEQAQALEKDLDSLQRFNLGARSTEPLALRVILADSFLFVPDPLRQMLELKADESLAAMPPVMANRVTLLEVFSNVLNNSAQAYSQAGQQSGTVEARAELEMHGDHGIVHLILSDRGPGLPEPELARIFQRGYTSSKEKRLGLGLHWCSNAINEMGGRIWAESPGLGQGFAIHIHLRAG